MDVSNISDPLERIARFSYQWFSGYFEGALKAGEEMGYFGYPNVEYARDYQCDGALIHPLLSCRAATNCSMYIQDRLMRKLDVPSLVVEGDIVDLKLFDAEDALRKAEVFHETMEYYRKIRKDKGLGW
jgi:hypothetical protein